MDKIKAQELVKRSCDFALQRHLAHVAMAMDALCLKLGYTKECDDWYIVGLLHDIDWNTTINDPQKHCGEETAEFLRANGLRDDLILAIRAHCDFQNLEIDNTIKKALVSVDELSGFCVAVALMRPTKMIGMNASSVIKKMKDKRFAQNVDRNSMKLIESYFDITLADALDQTLLPAFYKIAKDWKLT